MEIRYLTCDNMADVDLRVKLFRTTSEYLKYLEKRELVIVDHKGLGITVDSPLKIYDPDKMNTEDVIRLLQKFEPYFSLSQPKTPQIGSTYLDTNDMTLKQFDGTNWNVIGYIGNIIPYWIENLGDSNFNIWIKTSIPANSNKTIYIKKEDGYQPNGENVFLFFDDFDKNSLDTTKWDSYGPYTLSNGYINFTEDGKGIVSKKTFDEPYIIKSKLYYSGSGWFDHIYGIGSDDRGTWWTIEDGIVQDYDWVNATNTHNYGGSYTNNNCSVPTGEYEIEIGVNPHYIIINGKRFDKKHLAGYTNPGKIAIANYDANAAKWDYIFVRKYVDQEPTVSVEQISTNTWKVTIHNPNGYDLTNFQVCIPGSGIVTSKNESLLVLG